MSASLPAPLRPPLRPQPALPPKRSRPNRIRRLHRTSRKASAGSDERASHDAARSSPVSSERLFGILVLAVVALAAIPRESSGAPLVVGQDYYSVQLLSGTSAAVLQESLALVADQPYARIEKRGAEYTLRLGFWESREEAVPAARALLPKFRGAHTRIAPYQPDAIVDGAGEQPPIAAVAHPLTGARAPGGGTR